MPSVNLDSHKIYKAKIMKSHDESVKTAAPVCEADLSEVSQETKELVNLATIAEEVYQAEPIPSHPQNLPITSAGIKPPKQPLYYRIQAGLLRPMHAKALRRAVLKEIKQSSPKTLIQPTSPTKLLNAGASQILLDGTKVQIRAHRDPISRIGHQIIGTSAAESQQTLRKLKKVHKIAQTASTKLTATAQQMRHRPSRSELINAESRLGSTIFGPIPVGHRREFFHDRENVWIWHEAWTDQNQHARQLTIRYEVRPSGVYKKLSAGKYVELRGSELENFRQATKVYLHLIKQKLYAYAK